MTSNFPDSQLTTFGDIDPTLLDGSPFHISKDILVGLKRLPKKPGSKLRFVDFDDTLYDNKERKKQVDPILDLLKGEEAYPYIAEKYSDEMIIDLEKLSAKESHEKENKGISYDKQSAYDNIVKLLDPQNYLFKNIGSFYRDDNPDDYILTAGDPDLQRRKIEASGLDTRKKAIYVNSGVLKIRAILEKILELGYIPDMIEFYEDRIENPEFHHAADFISGALGGIRVEFYSTKEHNSYIADSVVPGDSGEGVKLTLSQFSGRVDRTLNI